MNRTARLIAALMIAALMFACSANAFADQPSQVEDGVLTIAMECAYAPYNWTQSDDSNGAVPIANVPGSFANGYDVKNAVENYIDSFYSKNTIGSRNTKS